ncbi:hypothetical protein CANTEDRAFT_112765 [Yamadazyma tenuis ATCC 10573]|uniref:Uncharacterized protein n=1 Tax=Candida tenuis (strain ATCC 10573 / BCRC 21748 / CBS 615 / JCM 9827 / NBRC 10315 / NRRL Y-1498 / VKM Y-70) TaxID=590646 RepID=G3AYN4_CANTC|nr:uncharacterized protein CANTEDRAFT_112765 [Yamadazyma tenuis ATCC 10573]EGV65896.1 hypothetical protein CANTEDRAFT_112765 [Yamadazyma tenuis ATCC 10573]
MGISMGISMGNKHTGCSQTSDQKVPTTGDPNTPLKINPTGIRLNPPCKTKG